MKIAFLNKYQEKVYRGSETFVYELSKRLSKNNQVDVIANVNYLDLYRKKYDIIIPTNGRWQAIVVRKIAYLSGAKVVIAGQSGVGFDDRINLYTFPHAFVALSTKAFNWAKKTNPFVKAFYIPNGVDLNKFKPGGKKFETKLKSPIVLAVGAFTEQKRLNLAIEAVAKLKNVSLLVVGGGGILKKQLEIQGREMLGDRFEIITLPFDKMPAVYRSADVFTLPSTTSESFGNVLVEAMASGLPVVASADPIRKEIVGEAGILVELTNTDIYAKALNETLSMKWDDKPRRQALKFNWDKIAIEYEELFKKLL